MQISKPEKLTDFPWLNIFRVLWENKNSKGEWLFASRKEEPRTGETDAVVVVPIHVQTNPITNHEFRRLVTCREYRIAIDDYEYAFPSGLKMPGEAVVDCAKRELREETGLQLTTVKRVSPTLYSSSGLTDESVVMVFCECVGSVSGEELEPAEELSVHLLDIDQIKDMCVSYGIKQSSKLWPVLYMFANLGTLTI